MPWPVIVEKLSAFGLAGEHRVGDVLERADRPDELTVLVLQRGNVRAHPHEGAVGPLDNVPGRRDDAGTSEDGAHGGLVRRHDPSVEKPCAPRASQSLARAGRAAPEADRTLVEPNDFAAWTAAETQSEWA